MGEFASAALLAVIGRALAEDGITVEVTRSAGALVPLAVKRRLVAGVAAAHGLLPLLRVGRMLPAFPDDPAVAALTAARGPVELFERWGRLERFLHSRHRVAVCETGAGHLVAEHVGPSGAPPLPAEDALVLGVLTALLATIGVGGLTVVLDGGEPVVVFDGGGFAEPPPGRPTGRWRFTWSSFDPVSRTQPHTSGVEARVRGLLAADLGHRWTLRGLADELGTSPRSLQRGLAEYGGFSTVLAATRADAAGRLLMTTDHPLGVIGFACGYTDQPHFTRDFKRRTAMTPAAYRSAFARTGSPSSLPTGRSEVVPA